MSRSRGGSNGWLWAIGIGLALLGVTAAAKAVGDVDGDGDEDFTDVSSWLNGKFGREWVQLGIKLGVSALLSGAPLWAQAAIPIVFQVDREFLGLPKNPQAKRQRANALLRQGKRQPA